MKLYFVVSDVFGFYCFRLGSISIWGVPSLRSVQWSVLGLSCFSVENICFLCCRTCCIFDVYLFTCLKWYRTLNVCHCREKFSVQQTTGSFYNMSGCLLHAAVKGLFPPSLHILSCPTKVLFFSLFKVSVLSSRAACFRWSVHIPLTTFAFQLCPHSMMKKVNGCTASPCCKKELKKKH